MTLLRALCLAGLAAALSACVSADATDRFVLGEASRANAAAQSERSVDLPNVKPVAATSGVRAAKAVTALNNGETKKLAETATGASQ
jgi:ABC-type uncharacterized transport system auxiliary subunit